ncbi:ankyrin repeat-containing domain protein [Xylaria arbuscula]|nr:ankyrin repeat-containing domain protein [Xylaria arbuscula]
MSSLISNETQWLEHKPLIRRLYLNEEKSLKAILEDLAARGLHATPSQLEGKLRKWKFRKNLKKREWMVIDHEIQKRKRDDKDSEVVLCGKRLKKMTVDKETARHRDKSVCAQLAPEENASSPQLTDRHVAVCTPQSVPLEYEWPSTLPWLRFSSRELRILQNVFISKNLEVGNKPSNELISGILPQVHILRANATHIGVSKLGAIIGRSMPEVYPQENLHRAQNLLAGSNDETIREHISMIIYNISNNTLNLEDEDDDSVQKKQIMLELLESYGLFDLNVNFRNLESPTISGFLVNIFDAATEQYFDPMNFRHIGREIRRADRATKWLATTGCYPTACATTLWSKFRYFCGLDDIATDNWVIEVTQCLLQAGADANLLLSFVYKNVIDRPRLEYEDSNPVHDSTHLLCTLIQCLLSFGASKNLERALHIAIIGYDKELAEKIIQAGADPAAELEPLWGSILHKETALTISAAMNTTRTRYVLDLLSTQFPTASSADFITPDAFIAAAGAGCDSTIELFYSISKELTANEYGITPLLAAASSGSLSTCQLILNLQPTSIQNTAETLSALHVASFFDHQHIVEFLIQRGANVNAVARIRNPKVITWIQAGISQDFSMHPDEIFTPLEAALGVDMEYGFVISGYSYSCAASLIRGGSKLTGYEVYSAAYSCHMELLSAALDAGGDPNEIDYETETKTALQGALEESKRNASQRRDVVSLLLSKGAWCFGGEVVSAIGLEDWEIVQLLLRHGGNLLDKNHSGRTALEQAIESKDRIAINRIFELEPSLYDAGALYVAIARKNDRVIQKLMKNRPSLMNSDPLEISSIAVAAQSGDLVLLRNLLAHRPANKFGPIPKKLDCADYPFTRNRYFTNVNNIHIRSCLQGSPLAPVAQKKNPQAIEACSELLKHGYRPDKLTWAMVADSDNVDFARTLLDNGQVYDPNDGVTLIPNPLQSAIDHDNREMMDLLIKAGINVNHRGSHPLFPIQLAVERGEFDFVKYLVEAGADVNAPVTKKKYMRSALQIAVEKGRTDIMEYLIQSGADVNCPPSPNRGATALQLAAIKGYLGIAKYLLDKGAKINAPPAHRNGRTALQGAAEHGRLDMLVFLLANGALTTGQHWRRRFVVAVKMAIDQNHFAAADLLRQRAGWSKQDEKLMERVQIHSNKRFGVEWDFIDEEIEISDDELDDSSATRDVEDVRVEHDVVFDPSTYEVFDFDLLPLPWLENADCNIGSNMNEGFVFEEERSNGTGFGLETIENTHIATNPSQELEACRSNTQGIEDTGVEHELALGALAIEEFDFEPFLSWSEDDNPASSLDW